MARLLDTLLGHKVAQQNMLAAIERGRLAPVILLLGPDGIGKKLLAQGLAQALVCEKSRQACGLCPSCLRVEKNSSESFLLVEPDGQNIKIDQTRQLQDWLSLRSLGKARVVIVSDADRLNTTASNSLLKTLEEPPADTYFFLLAPSRASVLGTIRSRSQIVRLSPLTIDEMKTLVPQAPLWALHSAQGQMSRLKMLATPEFDQMRKGVAPVVMSACQGTKSWAISQFKELAPDRPAAILFISFWQQILRDTVFQKLGLTQKLHPDIDVAPLLGLSADQLMSLMAVLTQGERDINGNIDRNLVLESAWIATQREFHATNP